MYVHVPIPVSVMIPVLPTSPFTRIYCPQLHIPSLPPPECHSLVTPRPRAEDHNVALAPDNSPANSGAPVGRRMHNHTHTACCSPWF